MGSQQRIETYKYLGIILNSKIPWSSHIECLCNKVPSKNQYSLTHNALPYNTISPNCVPVNYSEVYLTTETAMHSRTLTVSPTGHLLATE